MLESEASNWGLILHDFSKYLSVLITDRSVFMWYVQHSYSTVNDTKSGNSFTSAHFILSDYVVRVRRDSDKNGSSLTEYVRKGVIYKRPKHLETATSESICSELTIAKKKLFCMSIYRPQNHSNIDTFFNEITNSLTKASLN